MSKADSDVILERLMSLHPKVIDLSLERVRRLLATLGHPEKALPPVIHIAGTNGKGSTQAMIRAGLESEDKTVHAYTSPHLARFHERIRVAGELISESDLSNILNECERANAGEAITFFEITTVAAFLAFSRTPADFLLLEVGLGGRLDTTNVVDNPALTIITPISYDHPQFLGNTLAEIATEKAGILKSRVACVVGPQPDEAIEVIEKQAARLSAPLIAHGQNWHVSEEHGRMVFRDETGLLDLPLPNLIGAHQVQNAGAALAALRHLGIGEVGCKAAATSAQWPGRLQRLRKGLLVESAKGTEIWLDGGHNAAAGQALAEALTRLPKRPTHLICGMLNTKDVTGFMAPLRRISDTLTAVSIPGETATLAAHETCSAADSVGFKTGTADSVEAAVSEIAVDPDTRILICGSLYLAGHVLRENG